MFLLTACGGSAVDDNLVDCRCVLTNGKRQEKKPTSEGGRYKGSEDRRSNVKPMMAI